MPLPMQYHDFYGCSLAVMCTFLIPSFPDLYVYALHTAASPHKQPSMLPAFLHAITCAKHCSPAQHSIFGLNIPAKSPADESLIVGWLFYSQ